MTKSETLEKTMKCRKCGATVEPETYEGLAEKYPWFCPGCCENKFSFETVEVGNLQLVQSFACGDSMKSPLEWLAEMDDAWMVMNAVRIAELLRFLCEDRVLKKHVCDHAWTSGSSTVVWPVAVWSDGKIEFQLNGGRRTNDRLLRGVIARTKRGFGDVVFDCGTDAELYDGSCPVVFTVFLRNSRLARWTAENAELKKLSEDVNRADVV